MPRISHIFMARQVFRSPSPAQGIPLAVKREWPTMKPDWELLIISAGSSVVVVSQTIQVVFLYQALLGQPLTLADQSSCSSVGRWLRGSCRFFVCNLEEVSHFFSLFFYFIVAYLSEHPIQIAHFQKFYMHTRLRGDHCKITV